MSRRNPIRDVETLFEQMGRDVDRITRELRRVPGPVGELATGASRTLSMDIEDRAEEVVVTIDLPGYDREEIDLSVDEHRLRVRAGREAATDSPGRYVRRERQRSSIDRAIPLPGGVGIEGEEASATYTNGVLTVRLPKLSGSGGGRPIQITTDSDAALDVETINGLGPTYADRLREDGIESVDDLTTADIEAVAKSAEVPEERAQEWIEQARLGMIDGLGTTYADRLAEEGITTIEDMTAAGARAVADAADVTEERAQGWIDQARA